MHLGGATWGFVPRGAHSLILTKMHLGQHDISIYALGPSETDSTQQQNHSTIVTAATDIFWTSSQPLPDVFSSSHRSKCFHTCLRTVRWGGVSESVRNHAIPVHVTHPHAQLRIHMSARSFSLSPSSLVRIASAPSVSLHLRYIKIVALPQTEHPRIARLVSRPASSTSPRADTPHRARVSLKPRRSTRIRESTSPVLKGLLYIDRFHPFVRSLFSFSLPVAP